MQTDKIARTAFNGLALTGSAVAAQHTLQIALGLNALEATASAGIMVASLYPQFKLGIMNFRHLSHSLQCLSQPDTTPLGLKRSLVLPAVRWLLPSTVILPLAMTFAGMALSPEARQKLEQQAQQQQSQPGQNQPAQP